MDQQVIDHIIRQTTTILATYGLDVIAAILILIVGWTVAGWVQRLLRTRLSKSPRIDLTLVIFFANFARYAIVIFTIIAVLNRFGVATTSLIAVLGAAGLAIGLALQGTLSNVAAGVMLLIFRPFRLGDFIDVQGASGTVEDMSLFITELTTADGIQMTVPNGQIWGNAITNYSANPTRRMDLNIGIAYEEDLDRAFAAVHNILAHDARILKEPAPQVMLTNLGAKSQELVVRLWSRREDYWTTRFDVLKAIKQRFDIERIEMAFRQQVVYRQHPDHADDGLPLSTAPEQGD